MTQKTITLSLDKKDMRTNLKQGQRIIDKAGQEFAYDLAISILTKLYDEGYSIFQSYTREDIEGYLGHKPSEDEFDDLYYSLGCFENIRC